MAIPAIHKLDFLIQKYPQFFSKYSYIQKASRKLTDEELILAISGIIKQSPDWGLQDVRKFCKQIYGVTLPREKKLDYTISRLLHHLKPVQIASEEQKISDVCRENCLKNKFINHVDPGNAPFKKEAIVVKRPETLPSWDQSPSNISLAVKSSVQSIAIPGNDIQTLPANVKINNKSKFSAASQLRIKRTPKNMNDIQTLPANENINNKSKFPAASQFRIKRTSKNMHTIYIKGLVQNSEHELLAGTKIEVFALKKKIDEMYTSQSGEYELKINMELNKRYHISASMKDYATVKQEIVLKNKQENVISVNFNLVSKKTYTVCIKGVVQNSEHILLSGTNIEIFALEKKIGGMNTLKSGEYEIKINMKLNKSYHVSASMKDYATEKKEIVLKNEQEKVICVNFDLVSQKTARGNKSDLLIKNFEEFLNCGFDPTLVEMALKESGPSKELAFHHLP